MKWFERLRLWLEFRYCAPAYASFVLAAIGASFFGAAANTMVGWLYVLSGTTLALLGVAAWLPPRSLPALQVRRCRVCSVTAGQELEIALEIENTARRPRPLLEAIDLLPATLGPPQQQAIACILPGETYLWRYTVPAQQRGIYRWHEVQLRTAAPLGLFWSRCQREASAKAIVYPQVLPLSACPLLDSLGSEDVRSASAERYYSSASTGLTRGLRPYRYGDPPRLIHWRSSARFGDLRVRELEVASSGETVQIALDSAATWARGDFERAVVAAASLHAYARRCQLGVNLWTAGTGLVRNTHVAMETLAAVQPEEPPASRPDGPTIWLTPAVTECDRLPPGSRWLLFGRAMGPNAAGLTVTDLQPLQAQLQQPLR